MKYPIEKIPGRTVFADNKEYLWFGGTSYLGIPHHQEFQQLITEGFEKCGANWGSSRNNPLQLKIYEQLEHFLAKFTKAEASLTSSSGMLAGQMVLKYLENKYPNAQVIHAPRVHPALWMHTYKPNEASFDHFVKNIDEQIISTDNQEVIILADAVSSPHFELYNFEWVQNLPKNKKIILVVDDSHSLGVMGENGGGVYSQIPSQPHIEKIVIASMNKALGVPAGVILGFKNTLNEIRNTAFFAGCSPMSPAFAYASAHAETIYTNLLTVLRSNLDFFNKTLLKSIHIQNIDAHPAFCVNLEGAQQLLKENGILVPSFSYPSPTDTPITRLVISSLHTFDDLKLLAETLKKLI
jgi:8-amino-7-oxononanoate synthase